MRGVIVLGLVVSACAHPGYVQCEDGWICPANSVCELTRHLCISDAQQNICKTSNLHHGDFCDANGTPGICDDNLVCLPGCGDGVTNSDLGEECDDHNFASHDGCSSRCLDEIPQWVREPDRWAGAFGHAMAYNAAFGRLYLVGGQSDRGARTEQWERNGGSGEANEGWYVTLGSQAQPISTPPSRLNASLVYDPNGQKLVMFGGLTNTALAETWEFTVANGWVQKTPTASPPPRYSAAMVYDTVAQKVVLFGGYDGTTTFSDTWEYNGTTWTPVTGAAPPGRFNAGMAWDESRSRAVLFGGINGNIGALGDTWEYAAHAWNQVSTTTAPSPRFGHALAYYPDRNTPARAARIILFGGVNLTPTLLADTWEYTATGWKQLVGATSPPQRYGAVAAYFGINDSIVLVGGSAGLDTRPLADAWDLHDNTWTEHTPHYQPLARYGAPAVYHENLASFTAEIEVIGGLGTVLRTDGWTGDDTGFGQMQADGHPALFGHAMAFDPVRKKTVVFSGADAAGFSTATMEFEVKPPPNMTRVWTTPSFSTKPPARKFAAFGSDGTELVLFGGTTDAGPLGDTWEYDGAAWTNHTPAMGQGPEKSGAPAGAYDPIGKRMVVFDEVGQTWAYSNHAWSIVPPSGHPGPAARTDAMMTFDTQRKRIVLVGGRTSSQVFTDVWELDGQTWTQLDVSAGGPLPRYNAGFASHPRARKSFLIGGRDPASTFGDVWTLQFRSATPDEICDISNADDDGDLQLDSQDPDCCAYHDPPNCGF